MEISREYFLDQSLEGAKYASLLKELKYYLEKDEVHFSEILDSLGLLREIIGTTEHNQKGVATQLNYSAAGLQQGITRKLRIQFDAVGVIPDNNPEIVQIGCTTRDAAAISILQTKVKNVETVEEQWGEKQDGLTTFILRVKKDLFSALGEKVRGKMRSPDSISSEEFAFHENTSGLDSRFKFLQLIGELKKLVTEMKIPYPDLIKNLPLLAEFQKLLTGELEKLYKSIVTEIESFASLSINCQKINEVQYHNVSLNCETNDPDYEQKLRLKGYKFDRRDPITRTENGQEIFMFNLWMSRHNVIQLYQTAKLMEYTGIG